MNNLSVNAALHISDDQFLERSRWYGPNLLTFLSNPDETQSAFTLVRCTLRRGFEPPPHIHSREEESYVILEGEILYQAGDRRIYAKAGDYVHLPRFVPHSFKLISDTASFLLLITPGGFEKLFIEFSRPALKMELPPLPTEKPGNEFFERMTKANADLGVTMLPAL